MVEWGFVVHRPEVFDGGNRKTEAVLFHSGNKEIGSGTYNSIDPGPFLAAIEKFRR